MFPVYFFEKLSFRLGRDGPDCIGKITQISCDARVMDKDKLDKLRDSPTH